MKSRPTWSASTPCSTTLRSVSACVRGVPSAATVTSPKVSRPSSIESAISLLCAMIRAVKRLRPVYRNALTAFLLAVLLIPAVVNAQAPRLSPVPDAQQTDEQKAIAAEFAPNEMPNAVGTLLTYPSLARRIFTHDRYITSESTLMPRYRALLGLRAAWLARSN